MAVAPLLWDRGIRRLDYVVATHPQRDHVGGLAFILDKFEIGEFWTNGVRRDAAFLQRLAEVIAARRLRARSVSTADGEVWLEDCRVRIMNPDPLPGAEKPATDGKRLNNQSVVLRLVCGTSSFLLTGDMEREAEAELVRKGDILKSAVLKVPHHGARGAVYEPFLKAVTPRVAVVSVGRANAYGHPSPIMLETYARLGIPILRTDHHGAITATGTARGLELSCESGRQLRAVDRRKGHEWILDAEGQNLKRLLPWMRRGVAICDVS
jgi:competence protein ComEC